MRILVTGGAGFIGSAVIRHLLRETDPEVVLNLDALTYAGNLESLADVRDDERYRFEQVDVCDGDGVRRVLAELEPDVVMHLAAESHVDRSIDGPAAFVQTNVVGTCTLLEATLEHWRKLGAEARDAFRFHQVSTDEVHGSLGEEGYFTERSPHQPNSPYSASKAAADHFVRAWFHTYGLPVVTSNCSNNYGPYQFPEKLVPLMILNALEGHPLPVYGDGRQVRDWLHVEDHARALVAVATKGRPGETYMVGGREERANIELVHAICALLDELVPESPHAPHAQLIEHVRDRPGHDRRYAIDPTKIESELGWRARETLESGLRKTVQRYLDNREWCRRVQDGSYRRERLGLR